MNDPKRGEACIGDERPEKERLRDEFIGWYLLFCRNSKQITPALLQGYHSF